MYLGKLKDETLVKALLEDYKTSTIKELMIKYSLKRHEVVSLTVKNNITKRNDYWTQKEIEQVNNGEIPKGRTKKSVETYKQRNNLCKISGKIPWSKEEEQYIIDNWESKTDKELAQYLNRFPGSIKNKRIRMNLTVNQWSDVEKDILLGCSNLSDAVERLPNRTIESIKHMIRRFGITFSNKRLSYPHQIVCKQLNKLGLIYTIENKISKYYIDCYLPSLKLCIEVNGTYWHSKQDRKEKDMIKYKYLKDNGYTLLIITEEDTKNIKTVIKKIKEKVVNCWKILTCNDEDNQQPSS